ncbi:hypothetical protein [uncultured Aquimarina sp.]|uniref:hypothetical protein n=1 Tax=uncultured Aquimarina sp. TaxID=575652 RepID=UPI00262A7171|nr:hypothetical protein [uncultured Aquimarina sp.]
MKILKYILLVLFGLSLFGLVSRFLFPFPQTNALLIIGVLIILLCIPIYTILSLVKKKHRIEAFMMLVSIPLIMGVLFWLMSWPFGNEMIIIGSQIVCLSSIIFFIYSSIKKHKIGVSILFLAVGFCSLAFCFKVLFWPGSTALKFAAFLTIFVALVVLFVMKDKVTSGQLVLGVFLIISVYFLVERESRLYGILHMDLANQELNHPEDYYYYAWKLYNEGQIETAKTNLSLAIEELNNPNNIYQDRIPLENKKAYIKVYEHAKESLANNNWIILESPYALVPATP